MFVMHEGMRVNNCLVNMIALMMFGQVQPHANRHKHTRYNELNCNRLAESNYRDRAADKRTHWYAPFQGWVRQQQTVRG